MRASGKKGERKETGIGKKGRKRESEGEGERRENGECAGVVERRRRNRKMRGSLGKEEQEGEIKGRSSGSGGRR